MQFDAYCSWSSRFSSFRASVVVEVLSGFILFESNCLHGFVESLFCLGPLCQCEGVLSTWQSTTRKQGGMTRIGVMNPTWIVGVMSQSRGVSGWIVKVVGSYKMGYITSHATVDFTLITLWWDLHPISLISKWCVLQFLRCPLSVVCVRHGNPEPMLIRGRIDTTLNGSRDIWDHIRILDI